MTTQARLFWTVYKLDKGLSFRLGRSSNLRDEEITLPIDISDEPVQIARVQGRIYDQLYSPRGLSRPHEERSQIAAVLTAKLKDLVDVTQAEIAVRLILLSMLHPLTYARLVHSIHPPLRPPKHTGSTSKATLCASTRC